MAMQEYRTFPGNPDEGIDPLNILVRATVHFGGKNYDEHGRDFSQPRQHLTPLIDDITGRLDLPPDLLYGGFGSKTALQKLQPVDSITLEVMKAAGDNVVVLQRQNGDLYLEVANRTTVGQAEWHTFPPCKVNYRFRTAEETQALGLKDSRVVWTRTNQSNGANNRADVCQITGDRVTVDGIFPVTLDNGESFQVIRETRWAGSVMKRAKPGDYCVVSDDARIADAYANTEVAAFLRDYVLVPDEGYGNFELKGQLLLHKKVRDLLARGATRTWGGPVDFWIKPPIRIGLIDSKTAMVQMYLHGMSDPSQGFITLARPVEVGGRMHTTAQIRHHFIDCDTDPQGLKRIRPGDIVSFEKLVSMDNDGGQYPPLAIGVRVLYDMRDPT